MFIRNITCSSKLCVRAGPFPDFQCLSSGLMIPYRWRCDHKAHCNDTSDEDGCYAIHLEKKMEQTRAFLFSAFGSVTNGMILLVVMRPEMRSQSSSMFLLMLAISDTTFLWGDCMYVIGRYLDMRIGTWNCKFSNTILSWGSMNSAYSVVALSIERFLIVYFPLKAKNFITRGRAIGVIAVYSVCVFAICSAYIPTISDNFGLGDCFFTSRYMKNWNIIEASLNAYVPLILLLLANVAIMRTLHAQGRARRGMVGGADKGKKRKRDDANQQVTRKLVALSVLFFFTMVPYTVMQIYLYKNNYGGDVATPYTVANMDELGSTKVLIERVAMSVTNALRSVNHSFNLFLYCLTGTKFRDELKALFRFRKSVS